MLGIPTHLAPRVNAWATVRAFHAAAVASLVVAAVILLLLRASDPTLHVGGALIALIPMVAMISVHTQVGTWRSAAAFLLVGGLSAAAFSFTVERAVGGAGPTASYLVSLAIVPLVLVGGSGAVHGRVVLWSIAGFVVGRVATVLGTIRADGVVQPAVLAWVAFGFVIGIVGVGARTTAKLQRVQPELLRSAREEHVSAYRAGVEAEAAAILHDTVLNHLNAIALAPAGPIDDHLAETIESDVAALSGRGWLVGATAEDTPRDGAFVEMLDAERAAGLDVALTGDPGAIARLDGDAETAVVRAVAQCLANVRKHAETDRAEVSVFDDGVGCTVMVVDDGRGFDERETGADRLGLKNSVRQRIGRVGGDVQIWSSPGTGTSVMLTVPFPVAAASTTAPGPSSGGIPSTGNLSPGGALGTTGSGRLESTS